MQRVIKITRRWRPLQGTAVPLWGTVVALLLVLSGCAKYNTFFNARRAFDNAEHVREEALRQHQDPPPPSGQQKTNYETAISKAQKILDDYPGNGLTDDALFLQAKAYYRLESYRMSIRKLDLLFTNFPKSKYMEEALYLQGLDHLLIGSLVKSQESMDRLAKLFPKSKFQAETRKVIGDNAFTMKDWATAFDSYQAYLGQKTGVEEPDRIGLKLGQCCWELKRYDEALPVLDKVAENTLSQELAFNAKLLKARVLTRLERYDEAKALIDVLRPDAEIFHSQGMVTLVEAENLYAQGHGEDATTLLQNMPNDWNTPEVKARVADLLGHEFMRQDKWEDAKTNFQEALKNKKVLDDPDETRQLNDSLNDYLAAQTGLKDAKGDRNARLKLLEANALLFGLNRPGQAAWLYQEAATDTAADSSDAARALFGAVVAFRDHLDKPDSAAIFADQLTQHYPDSPQAFEVSGASGGRDLLDFLLDRRREIQQERLAALSPEDRAALEAAPQETSGLGSKVSSQVPVARRRMVYLSRRSNLVFPPPLRIIPVGRPVDVPPAALPDTTVGGGMPLGITNPESRTAAVDTTATSPQANPDEGKGEPAKEEPKKKKKKRNDTWDLLRAPRPGISP